MRLCSEALLQQEYYKKMESSYRDCHVATLAMQADLKEANELLSDHDYTLLAPEEVLKKLPAFMDGLREVTVRSIVHKLLAFMEAKLRQFERLKEEDPEALKQMRKALEIARTMSEVIPKEFADNRTEFLINGLKSLVSTRSCDAAVQEITKLIEPYTTESFDVMSGYDHESMKAIVEKVTSTKEEMGIQMLERVLSELHQVAQTWFLMACVLASSDKGEVSEAQDCAASAGCLHHILSKTDEASTNTTERKRSSDITNVLLQIVEVMKEKVEGNHPDHLCIQLMSCRERAKELSSEAEHRDADADMKEALENVLKVSEQFVSELGAKKLKASEAARSKALDDLRKLVGMQDTDDPQLKVWWKKLGAQPKWPDLVKIANETILQPTFAQKLHKSFHSAEQA